MIILSISSVAFLAKLFNNVLTSVMELPTPLNGNKAHQTRKFQFPQHEFGKTSIVKCSFQQQWFNRWLWLHYDEDQDLAFCFSCIVAYQNNQLQSAHCLENTFISTGFSNWKDAIAKLTKHECMLPIILFLGMTIERIYLALSSSQVI